VRRILILAAVMLVGAAVQAQTISPVVSETKIDKKGRAVGNLTVRNDTNYKEAVTIEAVGVRKNAEGKIEYTDVASGLVVELSDTSFMLPPHGLRTIYWKTSGANGQFHVMLFSSFHTMLHTTDGMGVVLKLGASAYGCSTKDDLKHCREVVLRSEGIDPSTHQVPPTQAQGH